MPCSIESYGILVAVSAGYLPVTGKSLTCYAPFRRSPPEYCYPALPLDLHVLSLPLAFILSQDQTLLCIFLILQVRFRHSQFHKEINALDFCVVGTCFLVLSFQSFQSTPSYSVPSGASFLTPRTHLRSSVRCPCFVTGSQR